MTQTILTGDRPTGSLHIGHYVGSLQNRVALQKEYDQYIMIADIQALTDNFKNPEKVRNNVMEVMLDYLACGLDKSTIFLQSQIPEIAELTMLYMNLVTVARLERNPTVKSEIQQKNFEGIPAGFLCYPVNQAADITIFLADKVPVGEDQLPMIEQTNEIVRKFNRIYKTDFLKECEAILSENKRLVGLDGKNKMSKSLGNTIFLKDSDEDIIRKVKMCYTDPNHVYVNDPGEVEGNVVFTYLDIFNDDKDENDSLKRRYRAGGLGDMMIKGRLSEVMIDFIRPLRERRNYYANNMDEVRRILKDGTEKARQKARENFAEVRRVVGLFY